MYEISALEEGDWVRLVLPKESQFSYGNLKQHNGRVFKIKSIHYVRDNASQKAYYELENLMSKYGVYYGVLPTWVQREKAPAQEDNK